MNALLARTLYFGLQALRREPVAAALRDVRRTEFISADELRDLQFRRQLDQLRFAVRCVPWYREHYGKLGQELANVRTWEQLDDLIARLPAVEKSQPSEHATSFTSDDAATRRTHLDKTSGSSGSPLIFPCDQEAWAYRHALTYRCAEAFGVAIGEPYALFFGLHWSKKTRAEVAIRDRVFNRTRISAYEIGREKLDAQLREVRAFRPTHFWGYPSAIYELCTLVKERGDDLRALRLKAVFVTAEPCRPHQRAMIEEITGARCVDTYGSAEGGLNATECPAGSLHLTSEATWVSLRDRSKESGEILVTDLFLRAFPLIRYAIGDEVVLKPGRCACGRPHPMLGAIEGRSGEPIDLPNGRRINANLPSYIFKPLASLGVIRRYRFVHRGPNLTLLLVVTNAFTDEHRLIVQRETASAFGADVHVDIQLVESLPQLANAKHRDYIREPA